MTQVAKFTDNSGQEWEAGIVFGHLKTMRESHGINTRATPKDFFASVAEVVGDEVKLYDLLLLLCAKQMKDRNIGPEEFGMLLGGETLRQASVAVTDALFDFCQGPNAAKEMAEAIRAAMTKADVKIGEAIKERMPSLISNLSAGKSPDSVASIQGLALSAN